MAFHSRNNEQKLGKKIQQTQGENDHINFHDKGIFKLALLKKNI